MTSTAPMPEHFNPPIKREMIRGKPVLVWRGAGLEIGTRDLDASERLRAEIWAALEARRINGPVNSAYLVTRHDPSKRPVAVPTVDLTQPEPAPMPEES